MINKLNYKIFLMVCFLVLLVLFIRIGDINFTDGKYIWAEDGNVFINQAFSLGWESIFTPYAGYIHLYPRLVSFFAVKFDLIYLPTIFFLAWTIAVLYCSLVIYEWIYRKTGSIIIGAIIPVLILLQPHSGESFFNITNAHWFLALALIILLIDEEHKINYKNFIIFILFGLTGPFSILVLPILFLNIFLKKDLKENYLKYVIVLISAGIQIYFMTQSNRISGVIDSNIFHWLQNMFNFFSFGLSGYFLILSFLIWCIAIFYTLKIFCDACQKKITENQINAILLIFALIIIYFAGVWSTKQSPQVLNPLGGGARYFVIPYVLLIISSPLLIKNKIVLSLFLGLMFITSFLQLNKGPYFKKSNMNFQSYLWLSNYVENIKIPIHPGGNWHINIKNTNTKENFTLIDSNKVKIINGEKTENGIKAINNDLQLLFDIPIFCKKSPYIGLEILLDREKDGHGQIFYAKTESMFSEENSMIRNYPAGNVTMQFAFKNNNIEKLRLDPTDKLEYVKVNEIKIYCDGIR